MCHYDTYNVIVILYCHYVLCVIICVIMALLGLVALKLNPTMVLQSAAHANLILRQKMVLWSFIERSLQIQSTELEANIEGESVE